MHIPNLDRAVQYMTPSSIDTHYQRFGRIGRSGQPALSILLAEPSVFQTVKNKKPKNLKDDVVVKVEDPDEEMADIEAEDNPDGQEVKFRKKLEHGIRQFVWTIDCRRATANGYFNN